MQQSKGTPWRSGGRGFFLGVPPGLGNSFPTFPEEIYICSAWKKIKRFWHFLACKAKRELETGCVAQLSAPACSVQGVGSTRPFTNSRPRGSGSGSAPGDYHSRDFPLHRCHHDSSQSPWSRKVILWDIYCIHFNLAHKTPMETWLLCHYYVLPRFIVIGNTFYSK